MSSRKLFVIVLGFLCCNILHRFLIFPRILIIWLASSQGPPLRTRLFFFSSRLVFPPQGSMGMHLSPRHGGGFLDGVSDTDRLVEVRDIQPKYRHSQERSNEKPERVRAFFYWVHKWKSKGLEMTQQTWPCLHVVFNQKRERLKK